MPYLWINFLLYKQAQFSYKISNIRKVYQYVKLSFRLQYCNSIRSVTVYSTIYCIIYADDIVIIANSEKETNKTLQILAHALKQLKINVNETKTKIMEVKKPNASKE